MVYLIVVALAIINKLQSIPMNHQTSKSIDYISLWEDTDCDAGDEAVCSGSVNAPKLSSTFKNTLAKNKGKLKAKDIEEFSINIEVKQPISSKYIQINNTEALEDRHNIFVLPKKEKEDEKKCQSVKSPKSVSYTSDEKRELWKKFKGQPSAVILKQLLP
jgi:hypothetical protein